MQVEASDWSAGLHPQRGGWRYAWGVTGVPYVEMNYSRKWLLLYVDNFNLILQVQQLQLLLWWHYIHVLTLSMTTSPGAEMFYSGIFGQGGGFSVFLETACSGNETSILQCPSMYYYTCSDHIRDIGVRCAPGLCTCSCSCLHMILYHSFIMLKFVSW